MQGGQLTGNYSSPKQMTDSFSQGGGYGNKEKKMDPRYILQVERVGNGVKLDVGNAREGSKYQG